MSEEGASMLIEKKNDMAVLEHGNILVVSENTTTNSTRTVSSEGQGQKDYKNNIRKIFKNPSQGGRGVRKREA